MPTTRDAALRKTAGCANVGATSMAVEGQAGASSTAAAAAARVQR
jgi:hypothetical protein